MDNGFHYETDIPSFLLNVNEILEIPHFTIKKFLDGRWSKDTLEPVVLIPAVIALVDFGL